MDNNPESIPSRCYDCPNYDMDRSLDYYNHPICKKTGWSINFGSTDGWDRMVWCPLVKKDERGN